MCLKDKNVRIKLDQKLSAKIAINNFEDKSFIFKKYANQSSNHDLKREINY